MTNKRNKAVARILSLFLVLSMSLSFAFVLFPVEAVAVTSLNGIEAIKTLGKFTILEIVPQAGSGSIGYYVAGQEPTSNWMNEIAKLTEESERRSYMTNLLASLSRRMIIGSSQEPSEKYPLNLLAQYDEYYPWEMYGEGYIDLYLEKSEEETVNNIRFTDVGEDKGDYVRADRYNFQADGGGNYVENVDYYIYGDKKEAGTYYYAVNFQQISLESDQIENYYDKPLYVQKSEGVYHYVGVLRESDTQGGINKDNLVVSDYFIATVVDEAPVENWEAAVDAPAPEAPATEDVATRAVTPARHSYYAKKNDEKPYRETVNSEKGYFTRTEAYKYVGTGKGNLELHRGGMEAGQRLVSTNILKVKGGYRNNNWFKRYVFDMDVDAFDKLDLKVKSVTPEQLTSKMIEEAGLVVVTAGFNRESEGTTSLTINYTSDITEELKAELKIKPLVVDSRIDGAAPNLKSLISTMVDGVVLGDKKTPDQYVYKFTTGSGTDSRANLITNDFNKEFVNKDPYALITAEIKYENFLRQTQDVNQLPEHVSMATCIRYILNPGRVDSNKDHIRVLDIEPATIYDSTDDKGPLKVDTVWGWLSPSAQAKLGSKDKITIHHISSVALAAKTNNLSESYDLIYVGADLNGIPFTREDYKNPSERVPDYNDPQMRGMFYTNIGDKFTGSRYLAGLRQGDVKISGYTWYIDNNEQTTVYRFSGNDISPRKRVELEEFGKAGLPIVVSDRLVGFGDGSAKGFSLRSSGYLEARIDMNSQLFKGLNAVWSRDNVFAESQLDSKPANGPKKEMLTEFLNLSRPQVILSKRPPEYSGTLQTSASSNGKLEYTFKITNPTDLTPLTTRYHANLYMDLNGDGRFLADELVSDTKITGGNNSELKENTEYTLTRDLEGLYSGLISWKLEVVKVGDDTVHGSQIGYTYVKPSKAIHMKVLQIRDKGVNLATDENFGKTFDVAKMQWIKNAITRNTEQRTRDDKILQYYSQISSAYTLDVYSVLTGELDLWLNDIQKKGKDPNRDFLDQFDMLIVGFGDMYGYNRSNPKEARFNKLTSDSVAKYIATGRSILYTHDTTSYISLPPQLQILDYGQAAMTGAWGAYFSAILRSPLGVDRYGVVDATYGRTSYHPLTANFGVDDGTGRPGDWRNNANTGPIANGYKAAWGSSEWISNDTLKKIEEAGYTIAYEPGQRGYLSSYTQGLTNFNIAASNIGANQLDPTLHTSHLNKDTSLAKSSLRMTATASRVNKGPISQFPFEITAEDIKISPTHFQYYQTNLNYDDLTVWYTLGGPNYDNAIHDGYNGYYIYNRGNVTYSGAGHFSGDYDTFGSDEEAKLFVNTMVAAYRGGTIPPVVEYRTPDNGGKQSIMLMTIEDDAYGNLSSAHHNAQYLNFMISDSNIRAQKDIQVEFFMEDDNGSVDQSLMDPVTKRAPKVRQLTLENEATQILDPAGNPVSKGNIQSGILYKMKIPTTVINQFNTSGGQGGMNSVGKQVKLYIKTTTTIDGDKKSGYDVMTLRGIGLLRLE